MNKMVVPNEILLEEAADLLSRGIEVILMTKETACFLSSGERRTAST